jgi:hypothetical protein
MLCPEDFLTVPSHSGLWEIPLNSHYNEEASGGQCTYLDQCVFTYQSSDDVFQWLKEDFWRYQSNKAPYTLPLHTNWFLGDHQVKGLKEFIRWVKAMPAVYFVTVTDYLLWMTDPSAHDAPKESFRPLEPEKSRQFSCSSPNTCELSHTDDKKDVNAVRYMRTCEDCPNKYPWLLPLEA